MNAHALAGGPRPALPPTLQPMALALAAPRTDKRVALLGSALAYLLIPAGLLALGKAAHPGVVGTPTSGNTIIFVDPPVLPGPATGLATPAPPQTPALPGPLAATDPTATPTEGTENLRALGELLSAPRLPGTGGPEAGTGTGPAHPPGISGPTRGDVDGGGGGIAQVSSDAVRILHQEVPVYPAAARAARQQGDVVVRMVIDIHGVPTSVQVEQGPGLLRAAAEQSARQWRFSPALVHGQAVPASFLLTLKFRLQ